MGEEIQLENMNRTFEEIIIEQQLKLLISTGYDNNYFEIRGLFIEDNCLKMEELPRLLYSLFVDIYHCYNQANYIISNIYKLMQDEYKVVFDFRSTNHENVMGSQKSICFINHTDAVLFVNEFDNKFKDKVFSILILSKLMG